MLTPAYYVVTGQTSFLV